MKNNSSQSRFGKITAKAIVMLLAVVMSLSVLPALSADILPDASAAEEYVVQEGVKRPDIDAKLQSLVAEGKTEINMRLAADINLYSQGFSKGITIPEGATVNLFLNGKTLSYDISVVGENPYLQVEGIACIINNGTLNVYSGSSVNASGAGKIVVRTVRTNIEAKNDNEYSYVRAEGIQNYGNLTVNSGVKIDMYVEHVYGRDGNDQYDGSSTVAVAGIYNATANASAVVNSVTINSSAKTGCVNSDSGTHTDRPGVSNSFAYGVYGGKITINGSTSIDVYTRTYSDQSGGTDSEKGASQTCVAYGVCSSGQITVNGGSFKYGAEDYNDNQAASDGTRHVYMGAVMYQSGNSSPIITDGTVTVANGTVFHAESDNKNEGSKVYSEGTVVCATKIPYGTGELFGATSNNLYKDPKNQSARPTGVNTGNFVDECGNTYDGSSSTVDGSHPTALSRGALSGQNRVHVVYRYWTDTAKNTLDTSIVDDDLNKGYSFRPMTSNPIVVSNPVVFTNLSNTKLAVGNNAAILYKNGGEPSNSYYWKADKITYMAAGETPFSDFNMAQRGRFDVYNFGTNTTGQANVTNGPIYIFVDYIKKTPSAIKAKVGTADVVTTTYTGSSILASQIGLQIIDSFDEVDITKEYNVDFSNSTSLINVNFSYAGTNTAGVEEKSEKGGLPKNAGTYQVTLHIADSVKYDPDPNKSKNRKGLEYTFALIIEQASVLRGNLDESFSLTYGQKLNEIIAVDTDKYQAGFFGTDYVSGKFSFANAGDGSTYKNVGTGITQIKWTPVYVSGAVEKNYKETVFSVSYEVTRAPLTVKPGAATVVYGESNFEFTSSVTGFVANDNTENNQNIVKDAIVYTLYYGGNYIAYQPGKIGVGSHEIRPSIPDYPAVLDNYEVVLAHGATANPEGVLTVTPRPLIVEAVAQDRAYIPGNYNVNVTFSIVSGKFGTDSIRVTNATGSLENCDAEQGKVVSGISADTIKGNLTGGAEANYEIKEVQYKTGEDLRVNISKAIPDAAVPTVADINYTQSRTLADIVLGKTESSVEGSWQWVDSTINPTVKVSQYKAQFVPVENQLKNYEIKVADVTINVKPTLVNVGYNATVSYGDNVPNITNYTYTSDIDTKFDIKKVTTSGNITPRTDYQKGSPVKAGGYAVTITAPNYVDVDGNYIFNVQNGIINVVPRVITFTVQNKTIVYGDSFNADSTGAVELTFDESLLVGKDTINSLTASGVAPTFAFESDFDNTTNYFAGEYTIGASFTGTASANYTIEVKSGTLFVEKAPLVIKANDFTLEYGSDVPANLYKALTLIGAKGGETLDAMIAGDKKVSVNTNYTKGSPVKAGGYEVTVGIAGVTFPNYEVTVQNGTITVIKATPVITTLPTATITYGETLGDAEFSGAVIADDVKGKFVYETPATVPAYSDSSYNSYKASFIPEDTDNYNVIRGQIISLTVGKKTVSGILSIAGVPMIGSEDGLTVDVTGLDPATAGSYSFVWYDSDNNVLGSGEKLLLKDEYKQKKIYVTATAATPYMGEVSSAEILIAPTLTDINTILATDVFVLSGINFGEDNKLVYDAQQKVVTFSKNGANSAKYEIGNILVKYNGSDKAPSDVGTYVVTVDIATPTDLDGLTYDETAKVWKNAKGAVVYSPVSNYEIGTLEITPRGYTVYVKADEKIYDGTVKATATVISEEGAVILAGGEKDKVAFDKSAVTYNFNTPDAGENKSVYAFEGDYLTGEAAGNYELTIVITNADTAVIKPMPLNVTVSAVEREYMPGNKNVDLTFDFTPAEGDDGFVYVDASKAKGTIDTDIAGSHYVTVSDIVLKGEKAANYELRIKDADKILAVITKATPFYPIPEVHDVLYYDSGRHLNEIKLPGSDDGKWTWVNPNAVPGAGVHTFEAVFTPKDQANYTTVEYDVAVEILKAPVTITAKSFDIVYGDIEPTYTYEAEGLTGADTIENAVEGYVLMNCTYHPGSNVGAYDILLDGAFESDNYEFTYVNGVVKVSERTVYVDVIAENREYKAGDKTVKVRFSALENVYSGDGASDVYLGYTDYVTGTITDENAGTRIVTYKLPDLLGTKYKNYKVSPKKTTVTVEILKATIPGVILPTSGKVYYGNKLSTVEFTSGAEGAEYGTFTMENPASTPEKLGTFNKTYKVVFTPNDTMNYATISQYITLEVLPAYINVSLHFTGTAQVGKTLYAIINDVPSEALSNLVYEWYRVDTPESDPRTGIKVASGVASYKLTEEDAGKYIMCAVTNVDGSPYECNAICVSESSVEELQLTFWQKFVNWFYKLISNFTQIFGGLLG